MSRLSRAPIPAPRSCSKRAARCSCPGSNKPRLFSKPGIRGKRAARRLPKSSPAPSTLRDTCRSLSRAAKINCPTRRFRATRTARRSDPSGEADATARYSPPCTMKAPRSATNGSSSAAEQPLFPFGFGLSYTRFDLSKLTVNASGHTVTASATVRNSGDAAGAATPQFYLTGPDGANIPLRLVGWERVDLKPDEQRQVDHLDRSATARDVRRGRQAVANPTRRYQLTAGFDSQRRALAATFELQSATLPP